MHRAPRNPTKQYTWDALGTQKRPAPTHGDGPAARPKPTRCGCSDCSLLGHDELHALVELALLARVVHVHGAVVAHHAGPHLALLPLVVGQLHAVHDHAVALLSLYHAYLLGEVWGRCALSPDGPV